MACYIPGCTRKVVYVVVPPAIRIALGFPGVRHYCERHMPTDIPIQE